MDRQYFEDAAVGDVVEHGEWTLTREEMVAFAERYDPQPIHVDEDAARETMYGGLIASGWQTVSVCMRLLVDGVLDDVAALGARGVDELRWHHPVRPGDTLRLRCEVTDKRPSESHPDRGYVDQRIEGINQDDEVVVSWTGLSIVARRPEE